MKLPEQTQRHRPNPWAKRYLNRQMRRWAKRDPENAPVKRVYRGWE